MGNSPWECKNREKDPRGGGGLYFICYTWLSHRGFHTFLQAPFKPTRKTWFLLGLQTPTKPHERGLLLMLEQHETILVHIENTTEAQAMGRRLGGTVLAWQTRDSRDSYFLNGQCQATCGHLLAPKLSTGDRQPAFFSYTYGISSSEQIPDLPDCQIPPTLPSGCPATAVEQAPFYTNILPGLASLTHLQVARGLLLWTDGAHTYSHLLRDCHLPQTNRWVTLNRVLGAW